MVNSKTPARLEWEAIKRQVEREARANRRVRQRAQGVCRERRSCDNCPRVTYCTKEHL